MSQKRNWRKNESDFVLTTHLAVHFVWRTLTHAGKVIATRYARRPTMRNVCELAIEHVVEARDCEGLQRLFQINAVATLDDETAGKVIYRGNWVDAKLEKDIFVAIDQNDVATEVTT